MLGGVNLIAELADDSIGVPPAGPGPVCAPVTLLRVVWHPAQFATALTRYSPRSTVGACAGLSTGGVAAGPIGLIMNVITALPSTISGWSGTGLCTGGCARRNEMRAAISASLISWYSMNGIAERPSGRTPEGSRRETGEAHNMPMPVSLSGVMFGTSIVPSGIGNVPPPDSGGLASPDLSDADSAGAGGESGQCAGPYAR